MPHEMCYRHTGASDLCINKTTKVYEMKWNFNSWVAHIYNNQMISDLLFK